MLAECQTLMKVPKSQGASQKGLFQGGTKVDRWILTSNSTMTATDTSKLFSTLFPPSEDAENQEY
jgi:hypothetical protein